MNSVMKRELLNDVLTGLLVAATFAVVAPTDAMADLAGAVGNTGTNVFGPVLKVVSYVSYAVGTVGIVTGIAGAKKHADNPGSNPLGPALGKLAAGAAFLTAPAIVGMMQATGTDVVGSTSGTVNTIGGF